MVSQPLRKDKDVDAQLACNSKQLVSTAARRYIRMCNLTVTAVAAGDCRGRCEPKGIPSRGCPAHRHHSGPPGAGMQLQAAQEGGQ